MSEILPRTWKSDQEHRKKVCPNCGCPVEDFVQPAQNKKNHMLRIVVSLVVIACVAIVGYGIYQYNNRITYYKVVDEINTARNESVDELMRVLLFWWMYGTMQYGK